MGAGFPVQATALGAGDSRVLRSTTLILISAEAMDRKMNSKKILAKIREKRMHVSFITRKGCVDGFTPVSWLASQDVSLAQ